MTSQANVVASQVQAMITKVNGEVGLRVPHHATTMASHLREFTMMNYCMFFRSKTDEDPKDVVDEVYKFVYDMG